MKNETATYTEVKEYYGQTLDSTNDLKTSACCTNDSIPEHHKKALANIDDEILNKFYGCGSPIPENLAGLTVLDLGCGTGRDAYLAAQLVGEKGFVIGVDMTDEQLEVANRHKENQRQRFGFSKSNIEFKKGFIERLDELDLAPNSIDLVISNCVINLSPDKERVFSEIYRVLKPGGELYFSDVFSGRRIPEALRTDPILYGECLSGALYTEDFRRLMQKICFTDTRTVSSRRIELNSPDLEQKAGMIDFYSQTVRAFKLEKLEDICEDYGQIAIYRGTIPEAPHSFFLDDHHIFETGKAYPVCGNTASMLADTRFGSHFSIIGDTSTHYGPFDCSDAPKENIGNSSASACC
ncbi:MAG: methyltransferase domain-containing protein [Calditrichaeota bacterium]|nr:MAG: methyltransferase domain-containing protein [Calditrichota bacterium]